ncbi:MAG: CehA/McbA family metallohydrolase [Planctomycetota bacterium]
MNRRQLSNPFELSGKWYKAALHTHTSSSDGAWTPEVAAEMYRKKGYDVLALTDHERSNDIRGLSGPDFLVINGIELHPLFPGRKCRNHHIVGLGVPHGYPQSRAAQKDVGECMKQIEDLGGIAILAHPPGVNVRPHLYADMPGLTAFELWASHQAKDGADDRERQWAEGLDAGIYLPAVATDDAHVDADVGTAWTWVKARSLSKRSVLAAIRTGACYASTGPEIKDFRATAETVEVRCSACVTITLLGPAGKRAERRAPSKARGISVLSIPRPDWPFVRAVSVNRAGRKAWTNPILLA